MREAVTRPWEADPSKLNKFELWKLERDGLDIIAKIGEKFFSFPSLRRRSPGLEKTYAEKGKGYLLETR